MLIDTIFGWVGFISIVVGWFKTDINRGAMRFTFLVGRDGTDYDRDLQQAAGYLPFIYVKSTSNRWVGDDKSLKKLPHNTKWSIDVDLDHNEEINYYSLHASQSDAICLSVISWAPPPTTHNHDLNAGMITGDLFRLCGFDWNHSGQGVATEGGGYTMVSCGWMATNRGFITKLDVNLGVMGHHFVKNFKNANLCGLGVGFERGWDGWMKPGPRKRSLPSPKDHIAAFGNQLRVHKDLSAIELCDSPTSWGSSFLSIEEGILCDMSTKTKIPICKVGETDGCFVYEKPRVNGGNTYSTKRDVYVKGSTMKYNATYFVVSDGSGKTLDDGKGY